MCGIVGLYGTQEDSWIDNMNRLQAYRGPDEEGIFRFRKDGEGTAAALSLGNTRLAIIDLKEGRQPMSTKDGRYTIVFNGEIFNAPELRSEYEAQGAAFMTDHSDTEVVLQGYALEGARAVKRLNGMFAFAIFDRKTGDLFCARDQMGIKPLYYAAQDGRVAFASELKSLLLLPFIKRQLNLQSFSHFMSLQYVPGEETIFDGIKRLPAGHHLLVRGSDKEAFIERYYTPHFSHGRARQLDAWIHDLRESLVASVKRWTLSDVPLACSLSGGLDSSAIVGILASCGIRVKTFSLGFSGKEAWEVNELPRARMVARKWKTDHREIVMNPEDLLDDLLSMVWHLDEPYGGGLPSWGVFKQMAKEVKVGLTGSGGDELFGNYGKWLFFGAPLGPAVDGEQHLVSADDFRKKFFERFYFFSDAEKREFLALPTTIQNTGDFLFRYFHQPSSMHVRDKVALTDISTQLPEEFLMMTDRFSAAHSLEARTPFLDREFTDLALSMPAEIRTKPSNLKYVLKKVIRPFLPWPLLFARKKGFVLPLAEWIRGPMKTFITRLLSPDRMKIHGLFSPVFFSRFVAPHLERKADYTNKIWMAVMFQLWHHVFMERKSIDKPTYNWKDMM